MDGKIIVDHPHLGRVEAEFTTVHVTVECDSGAPTSHAARLVMPPTVGGQEFGKFAIDFLDQLGEAAQDQESRRAFADARLLVWLHEAVPSLDPRRSRMFDPCSFDRSESLVELTRATNTRHCTAHERILAVAGELTESASDLLQLAIYERPLIEHPLTEAEHAAFRRMFLDELLDVTFELQGIAQNAFADVRKVVLRRKGDPRARRKALKILDEAIRGDQPEPFVGAIRIAASLVFAEAQRMEEERSGEFADLVCQTTDLLNSVGERAAVQGLFALAEGGTDVRPRFADLLADFPGETALDALLDGFVERFVERYDVVRPSVIGEEDLRSYGPVDSPPGADGELPEPEFSTEQQYVNALVLAKAGGCLIEKYRTLGEFRAQFVNRMESIRGICREAEMVYTRVLGDAFRSVYEALRPHLTQAERRLYQLLYFPQPFLDGRIALLDPVISSFVLNMDDDTRGVAYLALVEKADVLCPETCLRGELERRWQAYLRVYPAWLNLVRGDERERGRRKRARDARVTSLESVILGHPDGDSVELKALLPDPEAQQPDAETDTAVLGDDLPRLVAQYCSPVQARYLVGYFLERETEAATAAEAGVSQQAVSKGIRSGITRLRDGLLRDGVLPPQ